MPKFDTITGKEANQLEQKAVEDFSKKNQKEAQKLSEERKDSEKVLHVKSMFPFQLFPDELVVYKDKVTFTVNYGPKMKAVRDLDLKDVAQVQANAGPVFGNLQIISKLQTEQMISIDRLSNSDVMKAREVIQDLVDKIQGKSQEASIY